MATVNHRTALKNNLVNLALFTASVVMALLLAEVVIRLWGPNDIHIRGQNIVLRPNVVYDMPNLINPKLPDRLLHTRNNIGFRGPDWPPRDTTAIRIFTVGGSTTECFYLSDGDDWPAQLAATLPTLNGRPTWINNAGLDGHSTFGHTILLTEILWQYKPDYIIYLVGANEVGRYDLRDHRQDGIIARGQHGLRETLTRMAQVSDLAALTDNLIRGLRARNHGVTHTHIDFATLPKRIATVEELQQTLSVNETWYIPAYKERLERLMQLTLEYGITPILMTQPVPYGPAIDPETGVDMSTIMVRDGSGYQRWRELELYNEVTREVARNYQITLIDLERELPKNTTFYYDLIHFTQEGARMVANEVSEHFNNIYN
jgi:lysophospholipase L1-like esterase